MLATTSGHGQTCIITATALCMISLSMDVLQEARVSTGHLRPTCWCLKIHSLTACKGAWTLPTTRHLRPIVFILAIIAQQLQATTAKRDQTNCQSPADSTQSSQVPTQGLDSIATASCMSSSASFAAHCKPAWPKATVSPSSVSHSHSHRSGYISYGSCNQQCQQPVQQAAQ